MSDDVKEITLSASAVMEFIDGAECFDLENALEAALKQMAETGTDQVSLTINITKE